MTPQPQKGIPKRTCFTVCDTTVVIGNSDGSIEVYSLPGMKLVGIHQDTDKAITKITCNSPFQFAVGSKDYYVRMYNIKFQGQEADDMEEGEVTQGQAEVELVHTFDGNKSTVTALRWVRVVDQWYIVSGSNDGYMHIWNAASGKCIYKLKEHSGAIMSIMYDPNMPGIIFSGGEDQMVHAIELAKAKNMASNDQTNPKSGTRTKVDAVEEREVYLISTNPQDKKRSKAPHLFKQSKTNSFEIAKHITKSKDTKIQTMFTSDGVKETIHSSMSTS